MSDDPVFDVALAAVLRDEGGLVDDPADPGGLTNFGISQRSYPSVDIRALTPQTAGDIYRRDWWEKYGFGRLPAVLAIKMLDISVNVGPHHAIAFLQSALGDVGKCPVEIDGVLGPQTRVAAQAINADCVLAAYRDEAASYYRAIAASHPSEAKFLRGWLRRAAE